MVWSAPEPLGSRHRLEGFHCGKASLNDWLVRHAHHAQGSGSAKTFVVRDVGAHGTDAVDYPDFAAAVGRLVATSQCDFGVMIDAAGIGSAMAANKIRGVRAAMCNDEAAARNAREHNDANVMTLGAKLVDAAKALELVQLFVSSKCVEDRHKRRVAKIVALERN